VTKSLRPDICLIEERSGEVGVRGSFKRRKTQ
jgi:hypothetical protein